MSVGCDGVGGIVNGGDDKMGEEGQHGRSNAAKIIMVVSKSTIGGSRACPWRQFAISYVQAPLLSIY